MATVFVIDGKPANKQRLPYIPREGEIVEMATLKGIDRFIVELIQHRIDLKSPIGVVDTFIHLKSTSKKPKIKGDKNGAI
jgi:hypothetical protein